MTKSNCIIWTLFLWVVSTWNVLFSRAFYGNFLGFFSELFSWKSICNLFLLCVAVLTIVKRQLLSQITWILFPIILKVLAKIFLFNASPIALNFICIASRARLCAFSMLILVGTMCLSLKMVRFNISTIVGRAPAVDVFIWPILCAV